jgi:oxygen-independent coproporphyrinogen-3 oxidase
MPSFPDSFDFSKELSLYIHVPFCISKCAYCAFYSVAGCTDGLMDAYMQRLLTEIDAVNRRMEGRPYATAFIGGGNPGCLGPERLGRIAQAVCANGRPAEFSTEMNPESLTRNFFPLFERYFTRISMGVQSLDPQALRFLGRNTDIDRTVRGMELAQELRRESGCSLNYDLITCLGNWHDEMADVRQMVGRYHPDHLSVYALTLEEGTPLAGRRPDLPDADAQYGILKGIWSYLADEGYAHYEVSNFAREGHRCRHNCRYWDYRQYIGLGPGAASTAFDSGNNVTRHDFPHDVQAWCKGLPFSGAQSETLSGQEACEELVLMGLRHEDGLDLDRVAEFLGNSAKSDTIIQAATGIPGFRIKGRRLVPDEDGLMTADAAALTFLQRLS